MDTETKPQASLAGANYDPARLPSEVIEQDHELEARIKTNVKSLAELRWLHTLGPEGLLYNADGTPILMSRHSARPGEQKRRSFMQYGKAVDRSSDTISRMARGYAEWLRRQQGNDNTILSIADCVDLMLVRAEDRDALAAEAAERGWSVGHTHNVRTHEQRYQRHIEAAPQPKESAQDKDARVLETMRELGIPSRLMPVEERREVAIQRRAEDMKPRQHTPLDDAAYEHKMAADRLWALIRENESRDVLERQVNRTQDTLDMVRLLVEEAS